MALARMLPLAVALTVEPSRPRCATMLKALDMLKMNLGMLIIGEYMPTIF
jgi:hypothetical protein